MDLIRAGSIMRRELRRFVLPERQRLIVETLLDLSLSLGRPSVRIARLTWFTKLTGLEKAHVSRALRALKRDRLLVITPLDGTTEYQLLPDSDHWGITARLSRDEWDRMWSVVLDHNHLIQAELWPAPSLAQAVADVQWQSSVNNSLPNEQRVGDSQTTVANSATTVANSATTVANSATPQPPHGGVGGAFGSCTSERRKSNHESEDEEKEVHDDSSTSVTPLLPVNKSLSECATPSHDVGELVRWTTDQMLTLLRKVAKSIDQEHIAAWRQRIEHEKQAALVMAIIREAGLRCRRLRNPAGWMNRCYLSAMNNRKATP
jgi:hypothetical protein